MKRAVVTALPLLIFLSALFGVVAGCKSNELSVDNGSGVPADIQAVFDQPRYDGATWGLRVVDADSGKVLINLNSDSQLYIGSVRKTFSVGELLNKVGADKHYNTPVYRQGSVDNAGVLHGDLIVQASGDLTMGGRTKPDGSVAYYELDHTYADDLGNALLTKPDPLAGYKALAAQVAAAGIKEVTGDVIIDARLFPAFNFRNEFNVSPIFINDDQVDLTINPTTVGQPASVVWRPVSAALSVDNTLITSAAGTQETYDEKGNTDYLPQCIGTPGCTAGIRGQIPVDFKPPFTGKLPLVQTFKVTNQPNYARTVFIEALQAAGVRVDAPAVEENPTNLLPAKDSYPADTRVAELVGLPYSEDAKLILKVSYNIGADTSLILYGLTQGVDTMSGALAAEQKNLADNYGIPASDYHFVDGSGGYETTALTSAVTHMLEDLRDRTATFPAFFAALPIMGVDGLALSAPDYESDPTLAGATGQVRAKGGTYVDGQTLKGQAMAGYIHAKSGRQLIYILVVNNVHIAGIEDIVPVGEDEETVSAMLWRDY